MNDTRGQHPTVDYLSVQRPEWDRWVAERVEVVILRRGGFLGLEFVVDCPRCSHRTRHVREVVSYRGRVDRIHDRALRSLKGGEVTISCACEVAHGHESAAGCGAYWNLRFT